MEGKYGEHDEVGEYVVALGVAGWNGGQREGTG